MRCKSRENHETIDNSDPLKVAEISFMFLKTYHGSTFNQDFLKYYDLDSFMTIPLTFDHPKLEIPSNLKEIIEKILKNTKKGDKPNCTDLIQEFVDLVEVYENFFSSTPKVSDLGFVLLD